MQQIIIRRDFRGLILLLAVFVYCYPIRLFLIVVDPDIVEWTMPETARVALSDYHILQQVLFLIGLFAFGFVTIIVIQLLLPIIRKGFLGRYDSRPYLGRISLQFVVACFLASIIGYIGILLSQWSLGIGIQGVAPQSSLPFKLAGLLMYLKISVLPVIILVIIFIFERKKCTYWSRIAALSLICLGFMEMFLFDTRSGALRSVVLVVLLVWVGQIDLRRSDKIFILCCTFALLAMITLVTQKRLFGEAMDMTNVNLVVAGIKFVAFRITGVEHLMAAVHLSSFTQLQNSWDVVASERGVPGYYSLTLLGVDPWAQQTFAPSGLGWLYLIGGPLLVFIGGVAMGWATIGLYSWLSRFFPILAPVAKVQYLFMLATVISEGSVGPPITVGLLSCLTLFVIEKFFFLRIMSVHFNLVRNSH